MKLMKGLKGSIWLIYLWFHFVQVQYTRFLLGIVIYARVEYLFIWELRTKALFVRK
jgi:hypothetical protein